MAKKMAETGQITCAVFDLECTSLNADFGVVLCGVVLPALGKPRVFRADKLNERWDSCRSDDSAVVKAIADELVKYDILIAHNGAKFDLPFLRARLAKHGLPPFPNTIKLVDPVWLARNKWKMSYNSLEQLANFLGIKDPKTRVAGDKWLAASLDGCRKAMNYIVEHCIKDVHTLDKVVGALKPYSTQLNSYGSGY